MSTATYTEEELQLNMHNRIRCFLMDFEGLKTAEKGSTIDLDGGTRYCFPYPAIDWDSFRITGHSEMYYRKLSRENNWRSCIEFRRPQVKSLSVKDHKRYFCLILASVDDVPQDFDSYFNSLPNQLIVPLAVPLIDMDHTELDEDGEILRMSGKGVIAVYGPPDDMGYLSAESNAEKIKEAVQDNKGKLNSHGIFSLDLHDIKAVMFPNMSEVSIDFTYSIDVNMQEDHYWQPIY